MKRLFKLISLSIILALLITAVNLSSAFADSEQGQMETHAFYPAFIKYSPEMEKYIDGLDSISFAWSRLYADDLSELGTVRGQNGNKSFYFPSDYLEPVMYAKSKGKSIQLSIYADAACANNVLPYSEKRAAVIRTIMAELDKDISKGSSVYFDGVVIDFEGLRDKDKNGVDILVNGEHISTYYDMFLEELKTELDKDGKKLYAAVNPRIYFNGFDYRGIVKTADRMIVMAHDYEPAGKLTKANIEQYTGYDILNPINSPAPIKKVKLALEDVKNSIDGADLKKVWLQICFEYKQWRFDAASSGEWESLGDSALSREAGLGVSYDVVKARVDNTDGKGKSIAYGYNNELQCPYITYFNTSDKTYNVILYEDSTSVNSKIGMMKAYGMGGISLWSLGSIPDYTGGNGKKYHMDVWDNIISAGNSPGTEQGNTSGGTIHFKSALVESAVRDSIGKPDGYIYRNDVSGVYRLKLSGNLSGLDDLKYLTNLEYLDAQGLGLKDTSALAGLANLRVLKLQNNQIAVLKGLDKLKKLEKLELGGNKTSSISPLGGLTNLKTLDVSNNRVSDIKALKSLKKMSRLYLQRNSIKDISALQGMTALKELSLNGNQVSSLKALGNLTSLEKLYLKDNRISDVSPLKKLVKLNTLYLGGNSIRNFSPLSALYKNLKYCDFKIK